MTYLVNGTGKFRFFIKNGLFKISTIGHKFGVLSQLLFFNKILIFVEKFRPTQRYQTEIHDNEILQFGDKEMELAKPRNEKVFTY